MYPNRMINTEWRSAVSFKRLLLVTALFFLARPCMLRAQGNLLITPRRIVFEGTKRTEEINLANTGKDTARYEISLVEMTMTEDGKFAMSGPRDTVQNSASPYIRYYPHSIVLAPAEAQVIKVQMLKSDRLLPGEYRSHLYFRAKKEEGAQGDTTAGGSKNLSISVKPLFGICIPVILRLGENTTKASLSASTGSERKLAIDIKREGNMSVYGDLLIDHISTEGKVTRVGNVRGVAVYTTINKRRFDMSLNKAENVNYHTGRLHIAFTDNNASSKIIAETDVALK